jgi:RHS repeat-associated protein
VYISDTGNNRVLALRHDTLTLVAGGNGQGGAGDGGLATAAELFQPTRLAVSRNRTVLIVDVGNHDVREVGADAIIRRFAGGGSACFVDSIAATAAGCLDPTSVAVLPNGAVAIGTSNSVKVVDVGGTITTIAGLATLGTCDNHDSQVGVPALDAGVCPSGITAGADGSLYLAELDGQLFRRISPDGTLTQVRFCLPQFDGVALRAPTRIPVANQMFINGQCQHMTAGPDGALYVAGNGTIDKLDQVLPQYLNAAFRVASEDGAELYDFDGAGRHLRTLDALTNATLLTFGYDAQGRLTSIADADNNVTTFQRNGAGLATAIVSPYGETTTLTMDGQGRLTQVANPAGERMTLGYNADGILSTVTDPRQKLTRFTYDSLGRLTKEENPIGGSLTLARTVNDVADTVAVTDALARARRVSTTRGDNAVTVRTGTDAAGQRTTSTERADASTTTATPDQTLVTQFTVEDPRFGGQSRLTTQSTVRLPSNNTATVYFGRTVQLANPSDPSTLVRQTDTLVVAGQTFRGVYDATTRTFTATSPEGRTSSLVLDAKGRVMQVATAGLAPINYAYDTHGRLASISQGDRTETYTYNTQGRRATVIDPLSRVTSFSYDAAGHVISEALPGSRAVSFAYDSAGNLTSLTPPGKPAHTFSYSGANLPTAYQAPVVSGSTGTTSYSYSVQKELLSLTRPDSQVVGIGYDATGRPASVTSAEGTHTIGYHPSTGQVTSLVAPQGISQALRYDGALPTGTTWSGAVAGAVDFTYDNAFRLAGIQVNGDGVSDASYDRDGLPVTIGFLSLFYRSDNGLLERLFGAGYDSRWTYDSLAQVTTYAVVNQFSPTDTVFRAGYTYDRLGRITAIRERIQADTATYGFAYDNAGRLATVQKSGVTVAGYTYDLNGNRTQTVYPSQSLAGTYDNQDRLLSYGSNSYAYTGNGELTRKMSGTDTTRYRYDALGNLRDVYLPNGDHIEYVIDVQQRRIWRKLNGTLQKGWLYQNQLGIAAELGGSGNVTKTFQYGTHANVPDRMQFNGNGYRLVTDHLGSVRLVLDQSTGQVMQRLDYDAYGRVTQNTNPGFQPFGYAGGLLDDATGLVRFGARDYDPETGRWTAKEPLGIVAGGTNPYRYSDNSPVSLQDDNGFLPCCTASESRQIAQEISARLRPWQPVLEGVATAEMVLLGGFEAEGAAAVRAAARGYGSYRGLSRLSARACRELDFVAGADGSVFPVPRGAAGPAPTRSPGFQFTGGTGGHGLDSRVTGVRFMEANSNQGSRAVYMNASGQTVNPFTGQTVASSDPLAHFYFNLFAR